MPNCKYFAGASSAVMFVLLSGSPFSLLAQNETVATLDKRPIPMSELDARTSAKLEERQAAYELELRQLELNHKRAVAAYRETELNALLDERVLELEAARRKTTSQALLDAIKPAPTTDTEARAFYDDQLGQLGQPYEKLEAKIKEHLDTQARDAAKRSYLDSLRAKFHAVVLLEPEREGLDGTGPERGGCLGTRHDRGILGLPVSFLRALRARAESGHGEISGQGSTRI